MSHLHAMPHLHAIKLRRCIAWSVLGIFAVLLTGCEGCRQEAREQYYLQWEKLGREKREMLVRRVGEARGAQEDAQEQFEDALEQFQALVGHQGTDLEKMYDKLEGEYDDASSRTEEVRQRIVKVEIVVEGSSGGVQARAGSVNTNKAKRER